MSLDGGGASSSSSSLFSVLCSLCCCWVKENLPQTDTNDDNCLVWLQLISHSPVSCPASIATAIREFLLLFISLPKLWVSFFSLFLFFFLTRRLEGVDTTGLRSSLCVGDIDTIRYDAAFPCRLLRSGTKTRVKGKSENKRSC